MAQYFYDFKNMKAGVDLPNGLVRILGDLKADFHQEFYKTSEGMVDWKKNVDGVTNTYTFTCAYGPDAQATDVECLVKMVGLYAKDANAVNGGPTFYSRVVTDPSYQDGYEQAMSGTITNNNTFTRKRVSGVSETISGSAGGISRSNPVWVRWKVSGTNLQIKSWSDGNSEPGAWGQTLTDSAVSGPGSFGFGIPGGSGDGFGPSAGSQYIIHQLSFGTDGDAAPATFTRAVSGTVLDPLGDAAEGYIVRCYSRVTGAMLGETLSIAGGAFSFTLGTTEKVYCLAVDQLGNSWNAPIKDLIEPA